MSKQVVEVYAESTASPEAVWRLLADARSWRGWSGFHEADYEREGDPAPHGLGAIRRFRLGSMRSRETVLAFEPPRHFAYDYVGTLPFGEYRGDVTLTPHGAGTRITWHSEFTGRYWGVGPLLRAFMTFVLKDVSTKLARAAEPPADSLR